MPIPQIRSYSIVEARPPTPPHALPRFALAAFRDTATLWWRRLRPAGDPGSVAGDHLHDTLTRHRLRLDRSLFAARGLVVPAGLGYVLPDVLAGEAPGLVAALWLSAYGLAQGLVFLVRHRTRRSGAAAGLVCDALLLAVLAAPGSPVTGGLAALLVLAHVPYAASWMVLLPGLVGLAMTAEGGGWMSATLVGSATLMGLWLSKEQYRRLLAEAALYGALARATMTAALARSRTDALASGLQIRRRLLGTIATEVLTPLATGGISPAMVGPLYGHAGPLRLILGATPPPDRVRHYLELATLLDAEPATLQCHNVRLAEIVARVRIRARTACLVHGLDGLCVSVDPRLLVQALGALFRHADNPSAPLVLHGAADADGRVTLTFTYPIPGSPPGAAAEDDLDLLFAQHAFRAMGGALRPVEGPGRIVRCTLPAPDDDAPWLSRHQLNACLDPSGQA